MLKHLYKFNTITHAYVLQASQTRKISMCNAETDHHWSDQTSFPLQASQRKYYTHHSTNKGHDVQALSKYNHKMYSYHDPFN